jgi:hypothetical protein
MDKKIKKYSWIHELNAAAMKAKLLNEAEQYTKYQQFLAEEHTRLEEAKKGNYIQNLMDLLTAAKVEIDPKSRRHANKFREALEKDDPTKTSILDIQGLEDESGMGYPDPSGVESLNPNNSDMDGDGQGTANEVASDAQDWEAGDGDTTTDYENLGMSGPPTFPNVGMTPSPSAPVPPARFPSNLPPNEVTRVGTEDAINRGIIPQRKTRRLQDLQNQMAVDAALRAKGQAQKEGKLPASANKAGRAAGNQAIKDFKSNLGLEAAARDIMTRNPPTGPRPTEDDLRRIAGMFGRGV